MDSLNNEIINESLPYFIASNQIVQDKRLSLKARGLACYMRSMPNNWKFSYRGLMQTTGEGQTAILSALKELIEAGYLERIEGRDGQGHKTYRYILHMSPSVENPSVENPSVENQRTNKINNNKINNNINSVSQSQKTKTFVPPTLEEVETYIKEMGYNIDAEQFIAYYKANNWKDARNQPVKSWKQRVISWGGRRTKKQQEPTVSNCSKVDLSQYDDNAIEETNMDDFLQ